MHKATWKNIYNKFPPIQDRFDLTGLVFGKISVVKYSGKNKIKSIVWECKCECGNVFNTLGRHLRSGKDNCGCTTKEKIGLANTKHGKRNSTEYQAWSSMKFRCLNANGNSYHDYGGRGITICDEWIDSFETFYKDMGDKPDKSFSLDRIDNNKGYSKENCRWASRKAQCHNRSNSVGVDLSLVSKKLKITYKHAWSLYKSGRIDGYGNKI